MVDTNIIQALGAGSGIDTRNLIDQLVDIERSAPQARIDNQRELAQTQISDFGLLSNALATLQSAAETLTEPEALFSKSASFTESNALVPVELDTDVQTGVYSFSVEQVARSQTLAFGGFSDPTDAVGQGTLTFAFGSFARDADTGSINGAFTQDIDTESISITIDAENNTLEGLRDAINDADFGASASIIFDGTNYNLSILAESGGDNELEITAVEGDTAGLSNFEVTETSNAADVQGGQNAILTLNGITIERSTNEIDDIVEGLSLQVSQTTAEGELVTITVTDDEEFAEENIRAFVDAFNEFFTATEALFGVSEVENEEGEVESVRGSLASDSLARSVISQIRGLVGASIPGLSADASFTALTNIGIRTELDGSLSIDEDDFESALENNLEAVQRLFAPFTEVSQPSRGVLEGRAFADVTFPFTAGGDFNFQLAINGVNSGPLALPAATYNDGAEIAAAIESLVNADANFIAAEESVAVSFNELRGGLDFLVVGDDTATISVVDTSENAANNLGLVLSSSNIDVNSFGNNTQAGEFNVLVAQNPTNGSLQSQPLGALSFPLDTTGLDINFSVTLDTSASTTITLAPDVFANEAEIAVALQSAINAEANISNAGSSVSVSFNTVTGGFDFQSNSFGANSNFSINAASDDAINSLGLALAQGTAGTNAAGSVNGVAGFGSGNVILPALGEPGESLSLIIGQSATAATVNFSRGFAGELERLIDTLLGSSGVIATRTQTINTNVESLDDDQAQLDRRIEAFEARLVNQFIASERILASLNTSSTFLDNLINTLPFTANNDS